ncbi:MAG: hypothetical protein HOP11_02795 [Saprospiraceae bacterium]|nr:hypothetical protein [Saprospiraceae bacterium]
MYIKLYKEFKGHEGSVYALCNYYNSEEFISAGGDGKIVKWNIHEEHGKVIAEIPNHVFSLCFDKEFGNLFCGADNGSVYIINQNRETPARNILVHRKAIYDMCLHEDQLFVVSGDGSVSSFGKNKADSIQTMKLSSSGLRCIIYSQTKKCFIIGGQGGKIYTMNSINDVEQQVQIEGSRTIFSLLENPDKNLVIAGTMDARLHMLDINDLLQVQEPLNAHRFTINDMLRIPDTNIFVTASRDRTIRLWDIDSFNLLYSISNAENKAHMASVNKLLWLDSTNVLLSASDDRTIKAWKIEV